MPVDDALPPSRLPAFPDLERALRHFPAAFGVRVDTEGLNALPATEAQRYASARHLEPPEAVLLDRVLQRVPLHLLQSVERLVVLPTRGTGRPGGFLNGIVCISAFEADVRRPDPAYNSRFSFFTTTVIHEIGHAVFRTALAPAQQDLVLDRYAIRLDTAGSILGNEPTEQGTEHFFIDTFLPALLGFGGHAHGASAARRALAEFGIDLSE
jgi:hypothetical protein